MPKGPFIEARWDDGGKPITRVDASQLQNPLVAGAALGSIVRTTVAAMAQQHDVPQGQIMVVEAAVLKSMMDGFRGAVRQEYLSTRPVHVIPSRKTPRKRGRG